MKEIKQGNYIRVDSLNNTCHKDTPVLSETIGKTLEVDGSNVYGDVHVTLSNNLRYTISKGDFTLLETEEVTSIGDLLEGDLVVLVDVPDEGYEMHSDYYDRQCESSQGDTFKVINLCLDDGDVFLESQELLITLWTTPETLVKVTGEYIDLEEKGSPSEITLSVNGEQVDLSYGWDEFWTDVLDIADEETEQALEELIEEEPTQYIITGDSVTITSGGNTETITFDHTNFERVRDLTIAGKYTEALSLMNVSVGITNWGSGLLQIDNGEVSYGSMKLTGKLVDRIIGMMADGDEAFERFAKFLNLTQEQESFKTRERLMDFAAHDKLNLNEDGYVVAFKNVRSDYMDKHSNTFRNQVGDSPSMPRSMVDDDHNNTCSNGLHVCSPTYLKGFWGTSGKTMRVVVDPRDFVGIPYDYQDSKARVCKYTVVEDVTDKIGEYL